MKKQKASRRTKRAKRPAEPSIVEEAAGSKERDEVVRQLRSEIGRLKSRLVSRESGEEIIVHAVNQALDEPFDLTLPPRPKQSKKKNRLVGVLHISDVHFGKLTPTYDSSVAAERVIKAGQRVLEIVALQRQSSAVDDLRIYLGGDMVEGELIFGGQVHQIDQNVFDQACKTAPEATARLILMLAAEFNSVKVVAVPGNHGRSASRKSAASPLTNWDNVVYESTRLLVEKALPERVQWDLPSDRTEQWYAVDRVFRWGNLIVHGHEIRGWGGIPWYGTKMRTAGWIDIIDDPWDYLFFGHFHTCARYDINYRTVLANGSTESYNTYARQEMAAMGTPSQRFVLMNEKKGVVYDCQLYLDESRKPAADRQVLA